MIDLWFVECYLEVVLCKVFDDMIVYGVNVFFEFINDFDCGKLVDLLCVGKERYGFMELIDIL